MDCHHRIRFISIEIVKLQRDTPSTCLYLE